MKARKTNRNGMELFLFGDCCITSLGIEVFGVS